MGNFKDLTGMKFGRLTVVKRGEDYITPKGRKLLDGCVNVTVKKIFQKKINL